MMRIGHGFDVHRLVADRALILGGVTIPCEFGLLGHSDADVLLHAVADAVLGALGLGDIGRHFPDTDPALAGADSMQLLEQVVDMATQRGYRIGNVDVTVIAQRPKLAPHIAAMTANLARACRVAIARVNIKATTTEQLGYTGRGEGIATHAVALLQGAT
jgi:2-C-methyl-D-erythritol 2,4-cyclodiphosphate synthase